MVEENIEDSKKDVVTEPVNMVDMANAAALRLEAANLKHEENIKRQEALAVERALGGTADVQTPPSVESPKDYAEKVLSGELDEK